MAGNLLLGLIQALPPENVDTSSLEEEESDVTHPAVKNTFVHFDTGTSDPRRCRTSPTAEHIAQVDSEEAASDSDEPLLPVRNTFLHFQTDENNPIRRCSTSPTDPIRSDACLGSDVEMSQPLCPHFSSPSMPLEVTCPTSGDAVVPRLRTGDSLTHAVQDAAFLEPNIEIPFTAQYLGPCSFPCFDAISPCWPFTWPNDATGQPLPATLPCGAPMPLLGQELRMLTPWRDVFDSSSCEFLAAGAMADITACLESRVECVPSPATLELPIRYTWIESSRRINSKCTRLTKSVELQGLQFAFTLDPVRASQKRGGSSFQAAKGRSTIQVKCNSIFDKDLRITVMLENPNVARKDVQVRQARHNFSQASICKIPGIFDLESAIQDATAAFELSFEFKQPASGDVPQARSNRGRRR